MNNTKALPALLLALLLTLAPAACGAPAPKSETFPSIDSAYIPKALEVSAGKLGNVSYTSGITDGEGYTAVLTASFENTDEADYDALMGHYLGFSTGADENGALCFDWGWLTLEEGENGRITLNAYFQ